MDDQMIKINDNFHLSPTHEGDKASFIKFLNDPGVYDGTLRIPCPYTMADADFFINMCREKRQQFGKEMEFRIRLSETGEAIGGISLHGFNSPGSHKDELGYALARPYWGKGIMTQTVKIFTEYVLKNHGLVRIEAPVFLRNIASQRVLEKVGYTKEGIMKKMYRKDGEFLDAVMYAFVKK